MEPADWASLSDQELLERRIRELEADADALKTADETADQSFQILDQLEGDGPSKAR
jgi:hypothetical protein